MFTQNRRVKNNFPARTYLSDIMKKIIFVLALNFLIFQIVTAQTVDSKTANQTDVASIDEIMKSVYDVISGDAGQKRDWDRFRSLFYKDARLIPSGKNATTGVIGARSLSPEDYITRASANMEKEGFYEREKARHTEIYGNIAHVFSTYESFHSLSDKKPFMRGINSFQLLNDGKRWWIITIFWQGETPENPIPKKYLKSKK
jgi:hypothetical protein